MSYLCTILISAIVLILISLDHNDKLKFKGIRFFKRKNVDNKALTISTILLTVFLLVYISNTLFTGVELYIAYYCILLMVSLAIIDFYDMEVPNQYLLFSLLLIPVRIFFPYTSVLDHILGGVVGFGFFLLFGLVMEKVLHKEALGGGDIKLYGIIGLILGVQLTLLSIFIASLIGWVFSIIFIRNKEDVYLPFVPFIAIGFFVSYFYGLEILNWYFSFYGG